MLLTSKNYYGSKCVKNRVNCDLSSNKRIVILFFGYGKTKWQKVSILDKIKFLVSLENICLSEVQEIP